MIPQPANPELDVNAIAAFDQINPALIWGDGSIGLAVWQDWSGTQGDQASTSVKGQMVRIDGTPLGSEFLVNTQTAKSQGWPSAAKLDGGGFVVVWQDMSRTLGDATGASVKGQLLAADGSKVGGEFLINTSVNGDQFLPQVTGLHGGGFAVCWADAGASAADSSGLDIKAQAFDSAATKVGAETLVNTQTAGNQSGPVLAGLANGDFAVAWQDSSGTLGDADGTSIKLQLFDHDGAAKGTELLVNTQTAGNQTIPAIGALAGGGLVVAWEDRSSALGDSDGKAIAAQIFGADGTRVGNEFRINTETGSDQSAPSIAGLGDGGFFVSWTDNSGTLGDIEGTGIKARAFDKLGEATSDEILVNTSTAGNQTNVAVAAVGPAGAFAIWEDRAPRSGAALNYGAQLKAQAFLDPSAAPFILSDLQKHSTHPLKDDYLLGDAGNDVLKGRDGVDSLYGEGGNDWLDGGAGADHMEGGAGNDTFIVDNRLDHTHEHEDEGIDTVRSSVSFTLDENVENLVLTGKAAIGGRGNELDNRMTGNSANNILFGKDGNDRLIGGGGDDTLSGGTGRDVLLGGSGHDTLSGGAGKDVLTGGEGQDFFVFDNAPGTANLDKITDFNFGDNDKVQLSKGAFAGITHLGALTGDEFYAAAGATKSHDASDRVIYDTTSGKLYYDADGQGGAAAVQFAVMGSSSHPVLIYSDIQIIA